LRKLSPLLTITILGFAACTCAPEAVKNPAEEEAPTENSYYIDSQNGDDNNRGMSENSPWQTFDKVSDMTFQPGDNIYFKSGSSYDDGVTIISNQAAGVQVED